MNLFRLKPLLICLLLSATCTVAEAVPAYNRPARFTLPDGSQLTVRTYGDEFFHYKTTQDGYNIVQQSDGFYYYATLEADGSLQATSVRAKDPGRRTAQDNAVLGRVARGIPAGLAANRSMLNRARMATTAAAAGAEKVHPALQKALTSGDRFKSLVILVNFTDSKFRTSNPQQAFTNLLNQDGYGVNGATGSAWNYYQDNSNRRFNPQFVVTGPYDLPHKTAYYGGNNYGGNDADPWQMIVDACDAAYRAGVDFSQYADNGIVRDIFVYYAGYNEAEGGPDDTVWPHRSYINHTIGGVTVNGYACSSELKGSYGSTMASIGTFCHEFGHVMGWPDMYDTNYAADGQATALDVFSLMASGSYNNDSRTPPALNIFERSMVGWADPVELTKEGSYTLGAVEDDKGYIINTSNPNEYYIFENRQGNKYPWDKFFTSAIGTSGMVVYHVDQSENSVAGYSASYLWQINQLNAHADHECMKIVKAVDDDNYRSHWLFPGTGGVTDFTSGGVPSFTGWNGVPVGVDMTDIALSNQIVSFRLTSSGSATVKGIVTTLGQKPVQSALVKLTALSPAGTQTAQGLSTSGQPMATVYQATTDASGSFSVADVKPGSYRLSVTCNGYDEYIQNLDLIATTYNLRIALKTPDETRSKMYTYYRSYVNAVGLSELEPFTVAAQWDHADLNALPGDRYKLLGEEFYVVAGCATQVVIYINDNQVHSETVQPTIGGWTYVDLSSRNIVVQPGQSIKVGLNLSNYQGYPMAIDSKDNNDDKGSRFHTGDTWITNGNYTWAIRAYFSGNGVATGITLDPPNLETFNGDQTKLTYTLQPDGASGTVEWSTDNAEAVEMLPDNPGHIRALRPGTANVTATVTETGAKAVCRVTVKDEISGQVQIRLNSPDDVYLSWTPAIERDAWIVSWNEQGAPTWETEETTEPELQFGGLKADTKYDLRIGGKREDGFWGFRSMTFSTADVQYIESISLPAEIVTVPTYSVTVEPEISPISATSRELIWKTTDPQIATVDENGVVTGVKHGQTTLTVRAKFGDASASTVVKVEDEPAGYKATAYQNDALVEWQAVMHKGSWKVTYGKTGDGERTEITVDTLQVYLPLLTPGTKYTVSVQSITGDQLGAPTETTFSTEPVGSEYASMSGIKGIYSKGEKIQLTLIDIDKEMRAVEWTADGKKIEPPYVTLPEGEHTIKATVRFSGGSKEVFMKKVTVN